jgi:hypothetical protein
LDSRLHRNHGQYLVKWTGYEVSESTWEPYENLSHSRDLVSAFHAKNPSKPGPWTARGARRPPLERGNCHGLVSHSP